LVGDDGRQTVLVTGASTGLGLALARRLLDTDHRLILTARASSLARFAEAGIIEGTRVHVRALDVTSAAERHRLIEEADDRWGGVDVLVNNAGVMYRAVLEHVSDDERVAQMDVNYLAPMDLIRLVLPRMRARRAGRIINVSSVGGMMAMPTMAAYSASKFALEGATEALFYEVRPWNIRVSMVQPGFIHSEAYASVRFTAESRHAQDDVHAAYHAHYEHMSPFIARLMHVSRATPERVAKTIVRTMQRRRPPLRVPATMDAWVFAAMRRVLPRSLYHWILYRMLPDVKSWGHDDDDRLLTADQEAVPSDPSAPSARDRATPRR
jgi:NAD(P)-dependent dehydrogenase (short-subunit alcohol dehydrogenase family)